jgi:hypothetical protein
MLTWSAATVGRHHMLESDGASFAAVARDPFGNAATLHHFGHLIDGTAYRFGRMLVPLAAWVLAGGQAAATTVTLPIVVAAGFGLSVCAAAELARRRGKPAVLGLVVLAVPYTFLWVGTPHLVSDPVVTGLVLTTYLLHLDGRSRATRAGAAITVLAREAAVLAFVPLAWRDIRDRGRPALRDWAWTLVPYVTWSMWLRFRTGFFPFTDPARSRRDALTLPFVGIFRVFTQPLAAGPALTFVVLCATILLGYYVARHTEWFPVRDGALGLTAFVLCYGTSVWLLWGEALRVMSTAQACVLLALVLGRPDVAARPSVARDEAPPQWRRRPSSLSSHAPQLEGNGAAATRL